MGAIFSKVMWVGRATTFCVGLAVILAVVFGIATTALAAVPGDPFRLGRVNTLDQLTTLAGTVAGPLLKLDNNGTGSALSLETEAGVAPMKISVGSGKVTNLNADKLDGKDSSEFLAANGKATDSAHADKADTATSASSAATAGDADTLDGKDSTAFLGAGQKAADADRLDGMDSSDFQPSNPCPGGTMFHEGACIERLKRAAGPAFPNAEGVCRQAGRRLPTVAELQTFRLREGTDFSSAEFTSHVWFDDNGSGQTQKVMLVNPSGSQSVASGPVPYRCVAAPTVQTPVESTWEAAAQTDLRNAAAAATACSADNNGSYINCNSTVQLSLYGYKPTNGIIFQVTTATSTRWVARTQHVEGGSAYEFDTATGEIKPVPRF